jgi:SAM-dependent methyltransferase
MIDQARRHIPADPRLSFQQADGCALPFEGASFDAIVCQYGVMFFPDKVKAMREARRVLRPGGVYLFNVWDSLDANPIPGTVNRILEQTFPKDPPRFLHTPYGWGDRVQIERTARDGGFATLRIDHLVLPSEAPDAAAAATGFLQGTPLAADLADRSADLPAITAAAAKALAARFGDHPCRASMGAWVVAAG